MPSGERASLKILTATATARGWVQGIAQEEVPALRALIAAEARRFPRLGRAWREQGPERFAEPLAAALRACPELEIPDMDVASIQFYALVPYPHVVHSTYGDRLPLAQAEQLIERGVDMFLEYYRNGQGGSATRTKGEPCRPRRAAASGPQADGNHSGARPALADQAPELVLRLSGWRDLNPRPLRPERSALPSCATPRSPPVSRRHRLL